MTTASAPFDSLFTPANYIAGQWVHGGDGTTHTVVDKYHGTPLASLPQATPAQMDEAIAAAVAARQRLRTMSAGDRSAVLERLAAGLEANAGALARLIVAEAGKPIGYARAEISRCVTTVRTAAAEALRFTGETVPMDFGTGVGRTAFTRRFPVGVVAAITPFNFPLNLVLHKVAPAMAVGCPVIVKPAPQAPLSALALAGMLHDIDYPPGGVQVLVCGNPVAEQLVTDARVAMLSFTGSDAVGWHLKSICGKKKVTLELGGNGSVVVDERTDLAVAARTVALGANLYAGQTCISTQRIFVVASVADAFRQHLIAAYNELTCGDPAKDDVSVGPIIDRGDFDRIAAWVDEAVAAGATILTGGTPVDDAHNVYGATLLTDVPRDAKVSCAEVFGPVAVLETVPDFAAALARVNDSVYGLQAGVFTNNLAHMKQAHDTLEVGAVVINNVPGFRIDPMPYGGVKDSGLGREGLKYAMDEMSEPRLIVF
jgi:glyceraldehyde-3-phosphate dehydrogenase (NADP+)